MSTPDGPISPSRCFDHLDRPALHWSLGSAPVNLTLLLSILSPNLTQEEEALLRRLFLVRILEQRASDSTPTTSA